MRTRHGVGGNRVISLVSWCIVAVAAFLSNEFLPANTTADRANFRTGVPMRTGWSGGLD